MRLVKLIAALLALGSTSPAFAGYINFNAGQMVPDSAAGFTPGVCTAGSSPACTNATGVYGSFSGTADNTGWIVATLPQDSPAAPYMRCGYSFWQTTASSNPISFKFSFAAFPDSADRTPSTAGNTTAVLTYASPNVVSETVNHQSPSGTAVAVFNQSSATACSSSTCNGKTLLIKVTRVATDASDTNVQAALVDTVSCEICSNSSCT